MAQLHLPLPRSQKQVPPHRMHNRIRPRGHGAGSFYMWGGFRRTVHMGNLIILALAEVNLVKTIMLCVCDMPLIK